MCLVAAAQCEPRVARNQILLAEVQWQNVDVQFNHNCMQMMSLFPDCRNHEQGDLIDLYPEERQLLKGLQGSHALIAHISAALEVQAFQRLQCCQSCQARVCDAGAVVQRDADQVWHILPCLETLTCMLTELPGCMHCR